MVRQQNNLRKHATMSKNNVVEPATGRSRLHERPVDGVAEDGGREADPRDPHQAGHRLPDAASRPLRPRQRDPRSARTDSERRLRGQPHPLQGQTAPPPTPESVWISPPHPMPQPTSRRSHSDTNFDTPCLISIDIFRFPVH